MLNYILPRAYVTLADIGYHVYAFCFTCSPNVLNYLAFQLFNFERT